jgi:hypothetical protein
MAENADHAAHVGARDSTPTGARVGVGPYPRSQSSRRAGHTAHVGHARLRRRPRRARCAPRHGRIVRAWARPPVTQRAGPPWIPVRCRMTPSTRPQVRASDSTLTGAYAGDRPVTHGSPSLRHRHWMARAHGPRGTRAASKDDRDGRDGRDALLGTDGSRAPRRDHPSRCARGPLGSSCALPNDAEHAAANAGWGFNADGRLRRRRR